jgi:hypothetical protein
MVDLANGKGNAIPLMPAELTARTQMGVLLSIGGRTKVAVGIVHQ